MDHLKISLIAILTGLLLLAGCSGEKADVVAPLTIDPGVRDSSISEGGSALWGLWDVEYDPDAGEIP